MNATDKNTALKEALVKIASLSAMAEGWATAFAAWQLAADRINPHSGRFQDGATAADRIALDEAHRSATAALESATNGLDLALAQACRRVRAAYDERRYPE